MNSNRLGSRLRSWSQEAFVPTSQAGPWFRQSRCPTTILLREEMDKFRAGYVLGDTPTGVQAMLEVVELPDPPVRLAIGPGGLPRLIENFSSDIEEYKRFEDICELPPPMRR
jgi:hypothetical protein